MRAKGVAVAGIDHDGFENRPRPKKAEPVAAWAINTAFNTATVMIIEIKPAKPRPGSISKAATMKPKFTVRDLLLLTLAIGIACAWWGHYQQLSAELEELRAKSKHIEAAQQQVIAYKTVMDDLRDQHSQLRSVAADLWQLLEDSHVKIPQDVEQRYLILQKKHFAPGHNP